MKMEPSDINLALAPLDVVGSISLDVGEATLRTGVVYLVGLAALTHKEHNPGDSSLVAAVGQGV